MKRYITIQMIKWTRKYFLPEFTANSIAGDLHATINPAKCWLRLTIPAIGNMGRNCSKRVERLYSTAFVGIGTVSRCYFPLRSHKRHDLSLDLISLGRDILNYRIVSWTMARDLAGLRAFWELKYFFNSRIVSPQNGRCFSLILSAIICHNLSEILLSLNNIHIPTIFCGTMTQHIPAFHQTTV